MTPTFRGTRAPAVAGFFYPSEKEELTTLIRSSFSSPFGPGKLPARASLSQDNSSVIGAFVVPHAGYIYSGPVAAYSYLEVGKFFESSPEGQEFTVIIFGPNHNGIGSGVSLSPSRYWETPLGTIPIDEKFSELLASKSKIIDMDAVAHSSEHSIEVQIPFLQFVAGGRRKLKLVPVSMMLQDYETSRDVAAEVSSAISSTRDLNVGSNFLVLGSSDLTHYEPHNLAKSKDQKLIEQIVRLDIANFYAVLERNQISACGYGPIAVTMGIAKRLGHDTGNLLKYATSGDVSGDKSSVVGYPSISFNQRQKR